MRVKKTYIKEEHKMSTNRTPIYNLCQWEPEDPVLRTDFNADNAKLDAALLSHTRAIDQVRDLALSPQFSVGSYTGNGQDSLEIILILNKDI